MAELFCDDGELGYRASVTQLESGARLQLDAAYRLAHLPLIAPDHPDAIARQAGKPYEMGRHEPVHSLVLPVDDAALRQSPGFIALEQALRRSRFADKIAWDILPRRSDRLHATLCGSLSTGAAPRLASGAREALAKLGGIGVELRGLFSGDVNRGRLYLRAYPERRDGLNLFHQVQRALQRPETGLYLVGLYNLVDHLDERETRELAELLELWWDRPLLRFKASELWLMSARDDLVLDSRIEERLSLGPSLTASPAAPHPARRIANQPDRS